MVQKKAKNQQNSKPKNICLTKAKLKRFKHGVITPNTLLKSKDVKESYMQFFEDEELTKIREETQKPHKFLFYTANEQFNGRFVKTYGQQACENLTLKQVAYVLQQENLQKTKKNNKNTYFFWWYALMVYFDGNLDADEKKIDMKDFVKKFKDRAVNQDYEKHFQVCKLKPQALPQITHYASKTFDRTAKQKKDFRDKFLKQKKYSEEQKMFAEKVLTEFAEFEASERVDMVLRHLYLKGKSLTSATLLKVGEDGSSMPVCQPTNVIEKHGNKRKEPPTNNRASVKEKGTNLFLHGELGPRTKAKKQKVSKKKQVVENFEKQF